jgi:uncharacterized protein
MPESSPPTPPGPPAKARMVPCPACRRPALFSPENPFRPFCSARCQGQDFGAWASEEYRVGTPPPAEDQE